MMEEIYCIQKLPKISHLGRFFVNPSSTFKLANSQSNYIIWQYQPFFLYTENNNN